MKENILISLATVTMLLIQPSFAQDNALSEFSTTNQQLSTNADTQPAPEVGKAMHNYLIRNIEYNYSAKQAHVNDFKGKWLILDFWNKGCIACVNSFPKMSELAKKYTDKVQVLFVGREDAERQIRPMFERFYKKYDLKFASSFDSILMNQLKIYAAPHIFVIDPNGIVRGITYKVTEENIIQLLKGDDTKFPKLSEDKEVLSLERNKPYLVDGNGAAANDFTFRSVISKWSTDNARYIPVDLSMEKLDDGKYEFRALGIPLYKLYNLAYVGKMDWYSPDSLYSVFYKYPVLEVADSTNFDTRNQSAFGYSYCLTMDRNPTQEEVMDRFQGDLDFYFGYKTRIEKRLKPYWKLIVAKGFEKRILTKGGKESVVPGKMKGFIATNVPVSYLVTKLSLRSGLEFRPFIDETGLKENVDIDMGDCDWTDFEDVKKYLRKNGFELVEGQKEMNVIVFRDKR